MYIIYVMVTLVKILVVVLLVTGENTQNRVLPVKDQRATNQIKGISNEK